MTQNISLRDYGSRIDLLAKTQRKRLIKALQDEETLKLLRRSCERGQPIRIEIDDYWFPMSSMADLNALREELGLDDKVAA